jgi:hypothetical protein
MLPVLLAAVLTAATPHGWYCTDAQKQGVYMSPCFTRKQECDERRGRYAEDEWHTTTCRYQARAAVFTFFAKVEGTTAFLAYKTFGDCRENREFLVKYREEDYSDVSECYATDVAP